MARQEGPIQLVLEAGNVFRPGAPVDEKDLFAGRTDQMRQVIGAIAKRGYHAIIHGERGVGKTSLSFVLSEFLQEAGQIVIAPRVNCDGSDDYSTIWRKIFSEITFTREQREIGFGAEPVEVEASFAETLPSIITPDDVRRALLTLGRDVVLAVILDEFDKVTAPNVNGMFADTIKTLSDHSVSATLILVGVADSVSELIQKHESIERCLVQIHMPRMSRSELDEIIVKGMSRLQLEIEPAVMEAISILSQGLPHYTHLLGYHCAVNAIQNDQTQITIGDLQTGIRSALDDVSHSIRSAYHQATTSPRQESLYKEVLLGCALASKDDLGYFAAADVRNPLTQIMGRKMEIPSYAKHLKEFCEPKRGCILSQFGAKHRLRFRFHNPLMQPYITMMGYVDGLLKEAEFAEPV